MNIKSLLSLTLVFSMLSATAAPNGGSQGGNQGGGQPTQPIQGAPPLGAGDPFGDQQPPVDPPVNPSQAYSPGASRGQLPQAADLSSLQCSFKTVLEQDDARVLSGVLSAVQALEGTDACRPPEGGQNASRLLADSITNYQNANGGNLPGGYVGNVTTTCFNYERLFNQEYDFFLATFSPDSQTNAENFRSCTNADDRDAAVICAAGVLSTQKSRWEYECSQSSQAVEASRTVEVQVEAMQLAMRTLEEMINNPGCVDATGAGRASLIQSGFQLASRAAMIGMDPSSPFTVLASGAVGLISRLLGDLFTSEPQSEQLIARSQFNDLACMYEDIEARAFRCARNGIEAQLSANMDVERQVCAELNASSLTSYLNGLDSFIPQLSSVTRQLATTPADGANPLTSDQVRAMAAELEQPVTTGAGQPAPFSSLLNEAADRLLANVSPNMNRAQIEDYIRAHNLDVTTDEGRRNLRNELTAAHASAGALKAFVAQAQQKGQLLETEFDLTPDQLNEVRAALPPGGLDSISNVLRLAQRHASSEADQIAFFNARLEQGRTLGAVVTAQNERRAILGNIPQDNGILEGHRNSLQIMMAGRFENELERLVEQAQADQRNYNHANTTQVRKQEIVTQSLYPIVRMCNQLRTQAIEMEGNPVPDRLPRACNNFICSDNSMLGTFQYEMQQAGNLPRTGVDNRGRCTTRDCNGYYSQFICKERNKIESIRTNLYSEFDRTGTICGRPFGSIDFD